MKKTKTKLLAVLLTAAMGALTACGGSGSSETTAAASGESQAAETTAAVELAEGESVSQDTDITAAMLVDFTTMDPMDTSDTLSGGIQRLMMDGLFGFDDDMKIIPMLATDYEANDDATEFTIHLREGIQFSDGTPWNAEAAKANFDRLGDKNLGLKRTTLLCNVLKETEVVDDYTVKVTLENPFGAFIPTLAHPACVVMSPAVIAKGNEECAKNPVGTGQYTFVEWVAGEHATIALNKDWWGYNADICGGTALVDPDAGFKTITFKPVSENATRVAMLQSGDAQFIWPVPTESIETLRGDSNVAVGQEEGIVVRYLMMNNQKAPFNDVRVRQAINYAINKDAYCAVVKNGVATPATSIIGPNVQFYKGNDVYAYDIEKAKSLLAEAGYPDGFTMSLYIGSTTYREKMAQMLQYYWSQIGVTLDIKSSTMADWSAAVVDSWQSDVVNSYGVSWNSDPDPYGFLGKFFSSQTLHASSNAGGYNDPEMDDLLNEGFGSTDNAKRAESYKKVIEKVMNEYTGIYYAYECRNWAVSPKVHDAVLRADNQMLVATPFNNIWVEK